ncbi:hypothetical protein [Bacteroides reticulotermitis]|uniref:hypothetical protein n=1 Tax=Bacteroides reticulotermitis TaxID=1133319 RepID=UPI003A85920F
MKRKNCLDKISDAINNLETMVGVMQIPSESTIGYDCSVYEDEIENITEAFEKLRSNYGSETRAVFSEGLKSE